MAELIHVQICHALPQTSYLVDLQLPSGSTIGQAIKASEVLQRFPELDLAVNKVGLSGKLKTLDTLLREGDRIEIYRALQADPKESRRHRARRQP
jgi:putative ubiquitin-RnfH superfamily antitoxin RatB of RatAB toxin-antitoxin module